MRVDWCMLINQMRAVADDLRSGEGAIKDLGDLIERWANAIEREQPNNEVKKAVETSKCYQPFR